MDDESASDTLDNLVDVALDFSRYKEAEQYYRHALTIHLRRNGKSSSVCSLSVVPCGMILGGRRGARSMRIGTFWRPMDTI